MAKHEKIKKEGEEGENVNILFVLDVTKNEIFFLKNCTGVTVSWKGKGKQWTRVVELVIYKHCNVRQKVKDGRERKRILFDDNRVQLRSAREKRRAFISCAIVSSYCALKQQVEVIFLSDFHVHTHPCWAIKKEAAEEQQTKKVPQSLDSFWRRAFAYSVNNFLSLNS